MYYSAGPTTMVDLLLRTTHCAAHGGPLWSRSMRLRPVGSLLDETRSLLEEGRDVVCGSLESPGAAAEADQAAPTGLLV